MCRLMSFSVMVSKAPRFNAKARRRNGARESDSVRHDSRRIRRTTNSDYMYTILFVKDNTPMTR